MNRTDNFEKFKITKAATNKVGFNVYCDSFGIEKVRFQNATFEKGNSESISCYVDFEVIARLAEDVASGRLFKKISEANYGKYTVSLGGTKKGADGKPVSRTMTLGMANDKIFVNMTEGPGKLSDTGAIMPDGQPTKKVSVPIQIEQFRGIILYTNEWIQAYLGPFVHKIVKESEENRKSYKHEDE